MRLFLLAILCMCTVQLTAQSKGSTSFSFKGSYADAYMFRGHLFHDDSTIFGEAGIGMGKWSYRLHYAKPNTEEPLQDTLSAPFETEYTHEVSYTTIRGRKIITYGYMFYDYADGWQPDTQEMFTRVAHDTRWNPTYGISFDFDTYKGYYLDFSLTRFWSVTRRSQIVTNLRAAGSFDMTEERNDEDVVLEPAFFEDDGVNHASAHVKYVYQPRNWFKFETGVDYHYAFDDALYDEITVERDNTIWRTSITITLP